MAICVCCEGKIKRGDAVAHERCLEREPEDEKVIALRELQGNWRRVRDETAVLYAGTMGGTAPATAVSRGERMADLLYPGGRS